MKALYWTSLPILALFILSCSDVSKPYDEILSYTKWGVHYVSSDSPISSEIYDPISKIRGGGT